MASRKWWRISILLSVVRTTGGACANRYFHSASGTARPAAHERWWPKDFGSEGEFCIDSGALWEAQRKGLVGMERMCQDRGLEIQMLNKGQQILQNASARPSNWKNAGSNSWFGTQKDRRSFTDSGESMICGCSKNKKQKGCRESGNLEGWGNGWPDWEVAKKMEDGEWRLKSKKEKRKCQKSLTCRMR